MKNAIDIYGGDTIFGISCDDLNKKFQKSNAKLPDFSNWADPDTEVAITGSWNCIQTTPGGTQRLLFMMCTLNSGTAVQGATTNADLAGAWLKVQVRLTTISNADYTAKDAPGSGGTVNTPRANVTATDTIPSIVVITSDFPTVSKGILKYILPVTFQSYFNANIAQFNEVFAAVNPMVIVDTGNY